MRLLVFHPTIAPYRIDLFNALDRDFTLKVCLAYSNLRDQTFSDYDKILSSLSFEPHYLSKRFTLLNRVVSSGYWKEINKFKPDIVMVSEFGLDAIAALTYKSLHKANYKIVSICDDSFDMINSGNDFSKVHATMRKFIAPRLDGLILVEPKVAEWYDSHDCRSTFFPIVADETRLRKEYQQALSESNSLIDEYGLQSQKVFLFVGRLVPQKNIPTLISAFNKANTPDSKLVIVGDGSERVALENQVRQSKRSEDIIFTGRLEGLKLYAWYNLASCFVLPSIQEPFGAVTGEALTGGCFSLVSDRAGSNCLIENGVNGFTFNPEDIENLASKMQSSLIKPCERLSELRNSLMPKSFEQYYTELSLFLKSTV